MSGFEKRSNEPNEGYMMNQQIALPMPYSHGDDHEFGVNEHGAYPFPHQAFGSYTPQFASPYSHSISPHASQLSTNQSSGQSGPSTSDHLGLRNPSIHYMAPHSRYHQSPRYLPLRDALGSTEIESQDSRNEGTMLSEPVIPPLDGFPSVREFDQLMKSYVDDLSIKKQDKALIHARRARNIRTVLMDPKDTAIESAQFRFWVKKMFKLQVVGSGSPEVRVSLYPAILVVPKELISRFVKICPTCQLSSSRHDFSITKASITTHVETSEYDPTHGPPGHREF
ncbi:hypothetical protein FE257_005807 [Aspergillus nanangensis]|uniref:Integrase zinc-binding domain-containing protein n=1 Tax=Aspergillus nanangensis TaxID=2582783 RepID=A0AAD4CA46_ASPNN|nr:hypothetical protein FE257_005807 [Aspergillus nanangensis]